MELEILLDQRQDLYRLAGVIRWSLLEEAFLEFYSDRGRPALPIRRMVGLLILKQLYNLSDEVACDRWRENPYMQYFAEKPTFDGVIRANRANWCTSASGSERKGWD